MPRVVRKQNPPVHTNYKKYKPYLRLDFERRCAYCHIPELRYGTQGNFGVDHFCPKSRPEFLKLICRYSNLYYTCRDCNTFKGSKWPDSRLRSKGFHFLDPCKDNFRDHFAVEFNGAITPTTRAGEYVVLQLQLNSEYLCNWRRRKQRLAYQLSRLADLVAATAEGTADHENGSQLLAALQRQFADEFGDWW